MLKDVQEALEMFVNEPETRTLLVRNLALRDESYSDQIVEDSKSTPGFGPEDCTTLKEIRKMARK